MTLTTMMMTKVTVMTMVMMMTPTKFWLMATLPTAHLIGKHSRGKSAGLEGSAGTNVS